MDLLWPHHHQTLLDLTYFQCDIYPAWKMRHCLVIMVINCLLVWSDTCLCQRFVLQDELNRGCLWNMEWNSWQMCCDVLCLVYIANKLCLWPYRPQVTKQTNKHKTKHTNTQTNRHTHTRFKITEIFWSVTMSAGILQKEYTLRLLGVYLMSVLCMRCC